MDSRADFVLGASVMRICRSMPRRRFMMIRGVTAIRDIKLLGSGIVSLECSPRSWKMGVIRDIDIRGIPKIIAASRTLATEVVSPTNKEINFKLRQGQRPKLIPAEKIANSLVSSALEKVGGEEQVVYHKDMWNEKDCSHEGLGKVF